MTTTSTKPSPDVPLPTGAEWDNEWWDDEPPHQGYRIVHGRVRAVGESVHFNGEKGGLAEVETSACQFVDGTLDLNDPPQIQVHVYSDSGVSPEQARQLAAALLEAAAEVDRWLA